MLFLFIITIGLWILIGIAGEVWADKDQVGYIFRITPCIVWGTILGPFSWILTWWAIQRSNMSDTSPIGQNITFMLAEAEFLQSILVDFRTGQEVMFQPAQDLLAISIESKVNACVADRSLVIAFTENENRLLQQTLEGIFQGFNNENMIVETSAELMGPGGTDRNVLISILKKLEVAIKPIS